MIDIGVGCCHEIFKDLLECCGFLNSGNTNKESVIEKLLMEALRSFPWTLNYFIPLKVTEALRAHPNPSKINLNIKRDSGLKVVDGEPLIGMEKKNLEQEKVSNGPFFF